MKKTTLIIVLLCIILIAVIAAALGTKSCFDPRKQFTKRFGFSLPDEAKIVNCNASYGKWRIELTEEQFDSISSDLYKYLEESSFEEIPFADDESRNSYYNMFAFRDYYNLDDEYIWGGEILRKEHFFVKHCDYTSIALTKGANGRYYLIVVDL